MLCRFASHELFDSVDPVSVHGKFLKNFSSQPRKGNATVTSAPRKRCDAKMFIVTKFTFFLRFLHPHLERLAVHDSDDQRRKFVLVARRLSRNCSDCRHVVVMDARPTAYIDFSVIV